MSLVSDIIDQVSSDSSAHSSDVSRTARERLTGLLTELHDASSDVIGSVISSNDGIAWAQRLNPGYDEHRFAAMSSTLLALGDTFAKETDKGLINSVLIEGIGGNVYVMHAGPSLVLTIITRKNSNLGMTLAYARQTVEKIAELLI